MAEQFDKIRLMIKKFISPARYGENTFESRVGKLICDDYYDESELAFIDEMYDAYHAVATTEIDDKYIFPNKRLLLRYNSPGYELFYVSRRRIFNDIAHGLLKAGDNIKPLMVDYPIPYNGYGLEGVFYLSNIFQWFFDCRDYGSVTLRCDLTTNRKLFELNYLNTVAFFVYDKTNEKIEFLKKLHLVYGLIRHDIFD